MNFNKPTAHMIDFFFTFALFCVFSASAFAVVVIGANVYKSTIANMNENYTTRTSLTYVIEKIRQSDINGKVTVGTIENNSALILEEPINDIVYYTYIYAYNGELKELFIKKNQSFSPGDGKSILEVQNFIISKVGNNLIKLESTDSQGATLNAVINLQSITDNE